jgi:hypothetical protein
VRKNNHLILMLFLSITIVDIQFFTNNAIFADEQPDKIIIDEMERLASINKCAPNSDDIMPLLRKYKNNLSESQYLNVITRMVNMQHPMISNQALSSLYKSKIKSIRSCVLEYDIETHYKNTTPVDLRKIIFIMDKNHFFSDVTFKKGKFLDSYHLLRNVQAYNGEYVSYVKYFTDKSRLIEGGIIPFETLQDIFPTDNPLYYSCLLDLSIQKLANKTPLILQEILEGESGQTGVIFEKTSSVDGLDVIQVQAGLDKYFFDPAKDFSIVKIEKNRVIRKRENEGEIEPYEIFMMKNHIDCGNGIWIPQNITLIFNFGSRFDRKVTMTVSKVTINNKIDKNTFTDIFPDDAVVSDMVHQATYKWGDHPSINGLLKETVKPKSTRLYQRISVITGLIMIALAVVFEIRKRILQRRFS